MSRKFVAAVICLGGLLGHNASASDEARASFLADYRPHATRVRDAFTNITCDLNTTHFLADGASWAVSDVRLKYSFRGYVFEADSQQVLSAATKQWQTKPGMTEAANPRYAFRLRQQEGKPRVLDDIRPAGQPGGAAHAYVSVPYVNWQPFGRSYLDIASDPNVKVISYKDDRVKDRAVNRLVVDATIPNPINGRPMSLRVAFEFDPISRVCLGYAPADEASRKQWPKEERYEYEPRADEFPALKTCESRVYIDNPNGRLERRTEVKAFRRSKTPFPDSDFTLTAFGLPEPEGLPDPPKDAAHVWSVEADALSVPDPGPGRPWYFWPLVGGAAVVLVAAAVLVVRRVRRRPATPPGAPA
jgi:hypothetical protein